jgi:hypothetical protein
MSPFEDLAMTERDIFLLIWQMKIDGPLVFCHHRVVG